MHVVVAKYNIYNIITCYVWGNKSTPCAAKEEKKHGKDTQQAAAEKMIKIRNSLNYDYDVGA